jgi:hypothetical protein
VVEGSICCPGGSVYGSRESSDTECRAVRSTPVSDSARYCSHLAHRLTVELCYGKHNKEVSKDLACQ